MSRNSEDAWDEDVRRMLNEHQGQEQPAHDPNDEETQETEEGDPTALATELIREAFAKEPHRTQEEWERLYNEEEEPDPHVRLN